ncbi:hypothetical protein ACFQ3Z_38120 [Streptomyces nogalater]
MSLRTRLLCLSVALVAVGLLGTGLLVTTALRGYLQDRVDDRLVLTGQIAARLAPPSGAGTPPSVRALSVLGDTTVTYVDDTGATHRTFDASTAPRAAVPSCPVSTVPPSSPTGAALHRARARWRAPLAGHRPDPARPGLPPDSSAPRGSVVVATSLEEVHRTVTKTRNLSLTAGAALLTILGVAGWFAVRSGLRPSPGSRRPRRRSPPATTPTASPKWPPRTPKWDA